MRFGVMDCIMCVKNKIDPKTKEPLMSVNEFEERTLEAMEMLERVCKDKVIGYRAPNALVGGWMLDALEKIGFKYDSSISVNSLYNKTDSSLEGVSSFYFHPIDISNEKFPKVGKGRPLYWIVKGK